MVSLEIFLLANFSVLVKDGEIEGRDGSEDITNGKILFESSKY